MYNHIKHINYMFYPYKNDVVYSYTSHPYMPFCYRVKNNDKFILIGNDNETVEFPPYFKEVSNLIKNMVEDLPTNEGEPIPIKDFTSQQLRLLKTFVEILLNEPQNIEYSIRILKPVEIESLINMAKFFDIPLLIKPSFKVRFEYLFKSIESYITKLIEFELRRNQNQTIYDIVYNNLKNNYSDTTSENKRIITNIVLEKITYLNLSSLGLTYLDQNVFRGLTQVEEIDLSLNNLKNLPPTIFNALLKLQTLRLDNNMLTNLPAVIFNNLTQLRGLYLSGNQLTSLSIGVFDNLTQLFELNLNRNKLTTLPPGIFNPLKQIHLIKLLKNRLKMTVDEIKTQNPDLPSTTIIWVD